MIPVSSNTRHRLINQSRTTNLNNQQWQQPGTYPYQPPQAPLPQENKTKVLLIVLVVVVIIVICGLSTIHSNQTASSPNATAQSIPDQLRQAVPSLTSIPGTTITENAGDVAIKFYFTDPITVDSTLKARNIIITEEQHVWQANVAGIHIITISAAGMDSTTNAFEDLAKATVTEATANAIQWDSLTPTKAWSQFDKTWTIGDGTSEYGN